MAAGKFKEWLDADNLILIQGWARSGLSLEQIAHNMGVAFSTFREWIKKYPAISAAVKKGKEVTDFEVENALYKRAIGYDVEEVKTISEKDADGKAKVKVEKTKKHIAPDPTAMIFWLKNRKPKGWRDVHKIDVTEQVGKDEVEEELEETEEGKELLKKLYRLRGKMEKDGKK